MAKVPDYEERLTKFERMCVVKAFREDRTLIAASDYIADALGQRFVESVPLNMERAWSESHNRYLIQMSLGCKIHDICLYSVFFWVL